MSDEEPCAAQPSRHGRDCRRRGNAVGRGPRYWARAPRQRGHRPARADFAVTLNGTLEGKTDKQKNPYQKASLAWIVARLGGWSGYQRYRPAGPKTIAYGWNQFKTMS